MPEQEEVLAHHQLLPCTKGTRRLSWHPQSESLLAVAEGDRVCFINVAPTAGGVDVRAAPGMDVQHLVAFQ
jgi:hypothetical protein